LFGPFLLSVFLDAFLFDLTLSFTSISPQFDGVRLRGETSREFNELFLLRAVRGI